jgi:hypothetical protein
LPCGFGVVSLEEVTGLLLSTDWDLLDPERKGLAVVVDGVCEVPELVDLESNGEGSLFGNEELEDEELEVVVVVVVVEVEGEGERYLEGTCLPLGFLVAMCVLPLFCCWSFPEGKSGGLVRLGVLSVELVAAAAAS